MLILAFRRRPGWQRRSRMRRLACVVAVVVQAVRWCAPWPPGAPYRLIGMTRTSDTEWVMEFSAWPDYTPLYIWSNTREGIMRADAAMWAVGR